MCCGDDHLVPRICGANTASWTNILSSPLPSSGLRRLRKAVGVGVGGLRPCLVPPRLIKQITISSWMLSQRVRSIMSAELCMHSNILIGQQADGVSLRDLCSLLFAQMLQFRATRPRGHLFQSIWKRTSGWLSGRKYGLGDKC